VAYEATWCILRENGGAMPVKQQFRVEYLRENDSFYTFHTYKDTRREAKNEMRRVKELYKKNGKDYKFRVVEVHLLS
jgi:hypothetical protein